MTEQEQAKQETPPEDFFVYFDDMKKSEVIEMLWNRMSEDERAEILKEISEREDDDDDDEEDSDDDVCHCCEGINSKDCKADCIFYCESCKLYLSKKQRGFYNDQGEKCLACINQTQE